MQANESTGTLGAYQCAVRWPATAPVRRQSARLCFRTASVRGYRRSRGQQLNRTGVRVQVHKWSVEAKCSIRHAGRISSNLRVRSPRHAWAMSMIFLLHQPQLTPRRQMLPLRLGASGVSVITHTLLQRVTRFAGRRRPQIGRSPSLRIGTPVISSPSALTSRCTSTPPDGVRVQS